MTDKKPSRTFKERAWELWIHPWQTRLVIIATSVVVYILYAYALSSFLSSGQVISNPSELAVAIYKKITHDNGTGAAPWSVMFGGILVYGLMPVIFGMIAAFVWHSFVYPTSQKKFLERIKIFKANETKRLLRELLIKTETRLVTDFESARAGGHGARLLLDKIKSFAEDYVGLTDAMEIKITTLYSPKEIFSDAARQAAVHDLTKKILIRGKHLTRICIGEKQEFVDSEEMRWFKKLHTPQYPKQKVKILYVKNDVAMAGVADEIKGRADVLVLGGSVAFALRTYIKTDTAGATNMAGAGRLEVCPDVDKNVPDYQ